ncbi:ganglioside GM2 activator-like [Gigantopelta aegis]|uniref:ganglioside GM2 activator-like n=1 Tax=Gigantopelta aegis TaxID=1735272 RepID=UPI001B88A063|nr:ganglioside GM2 activator-like [Gigantopelta aegis]
MLVLLLVAVFSQSLAQHWTDTGNIKWRKCGTSHDWVHVTKFDIEPKPVLLPGTISVTLEGDISHRLGHQVTMDIIVEKQLLGTWVRVPCTGTHYNVGTCHYTDPCNYLRTFERDGQCPPQLQNNGIQCTCPFDPKQLRLTRAGFHIGAVTHGFEGFLRDNNEYQVTIKLNDKHNADVERMCIQARVHINVR